MGGNSAKKIPSGFKKASCFADVLSLLRLKFSEGFFVGASANSKQLNLHCLLCGSSGLKVFYEIADVPASCNLLWTSKEAAINCPRGSIRLAFCPNCSFIANYEIEPEKNQYGNLYDNSLFYSAHFQNFAKELANQLIRRYSLNQKNIVEIGCGKVDFLSLFCELGNNKGLRLNPATAENQSGSQCAPNLVESTMTFPEKSTHGCQIDFVFSYHELEHMNYPKGFLKSLRQMDGINSGTRFFFAVPNAKKTFEKGDFTDIIYEHFSYFTVSSCAISFPFVVSISLSSERLCMKSSTPSMFTLPFVSRELQSMNQVQRPQIVKWKTA